MLFFDLSYFKSMYFIFLILNLFLHRSPAAFLTSKCLGILTGAWYYFNRKKGWYLREVTGKKHLPGPETWLFQLDDTKPFFPWLFTKHPWKNGLFRVPGERSECPSKGRKRWALHLLNAIAASKIASGDCHNLRPWREAENWIRLHSDSV